MSRLRLKEIFAYLVVSLIAVGGGAFLSLQFLQSATSQEEAPGEVSNSLGPSEATLPTEKTAEERPYFPAPSGAESPGQSVRSIEIFLEPYIYDSNGRRDPFLPYEFSGEKEGVAAPLTALQRFDLKDLRLIGVMWDIREPKAMFVDPENKVHVIGRDEGIGNKNGYVESIREGEVVVVEAVRSDAGVEYQSKIIKLKR